MLLLRSPTASVVSEKGVNLGDTGNRFLHCPFCDSEIAPGTPVRTCQGCATAYHPDCWEWSGGKCQRLGCTTTVARENTATADAAGRLAQITLGDVSRAIRQTRRNMPVPSRASSLWRRRVPSFLAGAFGAIAFALFFRATTHTLIWAMGQAAFSQLLLAPSLEHIARNVWPWVAVGAIYGVLHRKHVLSEASGLNHLTRRVLFVLLLAAEGYLLGRALLIPAYLWGGHIEPFVWLHWLGPVSSFLGAGIGATLGYSVYIGKDSIFSLALAEFLALVVFGATALFGAVMTGYSVGTFAWAGGGALNLAVHFFSRTNLHYDFFRLGCGAGGMIGFARGIAWVLGKMNG